MLSVYLEQMDSAIYHPPTYFDNQYEDEWILEIGKNKNLTINLRHIMDFGRDDFELKILNTGEIAHNMREFVVVAGRFV